MIHHPNPHPERSSGQGRRISKQSRKGCFDLSDVSVVHSPAITFLSRFESLAVRQRFDSEEWFAFVIAWFGHLNSRS
jgi:hypothetical protein